MPRTSWLASQLYRESRFVNAVFQKSQQDSSPEKQSRMVPSLSETRWDCQFRASDTLFETTPAIFETLEDLESRFSRRRAEIWVALLKDFGYASMQGSWLPW
ncbi:hypothetical protein Pmar_PMAR026048 [Perkinsus marinus ATCC 50983]|uniref:Uncharacterized protein n=1 Tax=Perkinsus marinus (strain ATCC 50983 / TXsc) TaxID=423536 RepID=C5LKA2_PERM5|nr:hypothetical protein Pmar_PMAR026048 [Perkinsus marinus ATCC 50983]EER02889.1 hypothetical protein Pmar_PMAR026048 [Perkinsus marinus ATCC 50983]|eukprot:XP_002771073.1 hypothetical protein Pmar_PMAR026048 [Perkinsus marinus ATCC 50983]